MSDSRRRRKSQVSRGSDDLSDSYDDLNATKETQNSEQAEDRHDSEYDTAGSDSNSESQDGAQRESGDGQEEEKPAKKLDDDEDRRNPQYIPKRGTFYEHDDRTAEEAEDNAVETPPERETKEKKVWKDKEDRWDHDRYNDEEQAPKSHEELIAVYGYDIRNEEGPPRARRRRRYGRGPNKYTRNWEDENAYGKVPATNTPKSSSRRMNRSGEEFPALNSKNKDSLDRVEEPVISSAWYNNKNKTQPKTQNFPPLQSQQDGDKSKPVKTMNNQQIENKVIDQNNVARKKEVRTPTQIDSPNGNTSGSTLGNQEKVVANVKLATRENKRFSQENQTRSRGRGYKSNQNNNIINKIPPTENKMKGRGTVPGVVENKRMVPVVDEQQLVQDMKQVHVSDSSFHQGRQSKHFYTQSSSQQRTSIGPSPRMQQPHQQPQIHQQQPPPQQQQPQQQQQQAQQADVAGNRPKRYSSLRQRPPITEGPSQQNYPPQPQQHGYYTTQAGNSRGVLDSQGYPPSHYEQAAPVAPTSGPMNAQQVLPMAPPGAQPTGFAPPAFLVPPPQFIAQQPAPPNLINYVPAPNGPAFQNYQGYQGYNPGVQVHEQVDYVQPGPPPPPQELFQPQGCTYYSPQQQQPPPPPSAPLRRPIHAIPILPPPDNQQCIQASKGRGRPILQNPQQRGMSQLEAHMQSHPEMSMQMRHGHNVQMESHQSQLMMQQQMQQVQSEHRPGPNQMESHVQMQQQMPVQFEMQPQTLPEVQPTISEPENLLPVQPEPEPQVSPVEPEPVQVPVPVESEEVIEKPEIQADVQEEVEVKEVELVPEPELQVPVQEESQIEVPVAEEIVKSEPEVQIVPELSEPVIQAEIQEIQAEISVVPEAQVELEKKDETEEKTAKPPLTLDDLDDDMIRNIVNDYTEKILSKDTPVLETNEIVSVEESVKEIQPQEETKNEVQVSESIAELKAPELEVRKDEPIIETEKVEPVLKQVENDVFLIANNVVDNKCLEKIVVEAENDIAPSDLAKTVTVEGLIKPLLNDENLVKSEPEVATASPVIEDAAA